MKSLELSVAGKTFIAGEYLALTGGPALVMATEPRFTLKVQEGPQLENPFHPQSPAGKLWDRHGDFFSKYNLKFTDPYRVGGFGASSAQFALLHAFWQVQEDAYLESERFFDWHLMLSDYRGLDFDGTPPSGADVIGAVSGGLTLFDRNNGKVQTFAWPFQETVFFLAHTGQKLATHEHLKNLNEFPTENFYQAMLQIQQGLISVNFELFLQGMTDYRQELKAQSRVARFTLEKVQALEKNSSVLFAKGCGAMGSDVILTLCRKEDSEKVRGLLQKEGLQVIASSSDVSPGLQIRNLNFGSKELSL